MTTHSDDVMDLLVGYVLDALEPEQSLQVAQLLKEQPALLQTLAELRSAADAMPYALPDVVLSPDMKERTLAYAVGRAGRAAPFAANTTRMRRWMAAAGAVTAAALLALALVWQQLASTQAEVVALRLQQQQFAATITRSVALVEMTGADGRGMVMRTAEGSVLVAAHLPQLQHDRVYQFWLIDGAAAPVSGGTFVVDAQGNGILTFAAGVPVVDADSFAVTDEPNGGSNGPTTQPLIVGRSSSA